MERLHAELGKRKMGAGSPSDTSTGSTFVTNGTTRRIRIKALARPKVDHAKIARLVVKIMESDSDGELLKLAKRKRRRRR